MKDRQKRLTQVYDYLRQFYGIHTQTDFAAAIKYSRPVVSSALNGNVSYLTDNLFEGICSAFPGLFNLNYLLNGEGTLIEGSVYSEKEQEKEVVANDLPIQSETKGKPYYNVDFTLGFDVLLNDQTQNPDYLIDFPPYNDCDCWCNAHGNSMYPTIASGDIVALKRIDDISYLINGEIYAIVTSNGLRTIKRIRDNGTTFTLIADNKEVGNQDIPKELVTHAYLVRGTIKMF